jgi:hypothetical protein
VSVDIYELSETRYTLSVRELYDGESPTERAWDIESYDSSGRVIANGVASTFLLALEELFRDFPSEKGEE